MSAVFVSGAKHNKFSHNPGPDETRAGAIVFFDPFPVSELAGKDGCSPTPQQLP